MHEATVEGHTPARAHVEDFLLLLRRLTRTPHFGVEFRGARRGGRSYKRPVVAGHLCETAVTSRPSKECSTFPISLFLDQPFEIVQILVDPTRNGAAEARGQLQGHARALIRKRREGNDSGSEMIRSAVVGQSSPGESPLRNAQHDLKCRLILLSVETKRRDKMVRVQFSDAFDRCDKFWIILKPQPAFVDIGNRRIDYD